MLNLEFEAVSLISKSQAVGKEMGELLQLLKVIKRNDELKLLVDELLKLAVRLDNIVDPHWQEANFYRELH